MKRKYWKLAAVMILLGIILYPAAYAKKSGEKRIKPSAAESEREVTEAQVPTAALAALKKQAGDTQITNFAEEIEHGSTFYEGSWKAPSGRNMDVLVTPTGDLVNIEEKVTADQVPAAVLKAARKKAGEDTKLKFEKKTMILYEVKLKKGEKKRELLFTPDGRCFKKEFDKKAKKCEQEKDENEDEGEDDDDKK
ncbi:MAG: PepSY-like domain-containing protein [Planctomycetota bacterium]|jgi:hypothetical protein